MEKVVSILHQPFYLATIDGDQPRVRAFDSCTEYNGKIYFETITTKKVYHQLKLNPKFELFTMGEGTTLRLTGEAIEERDQEIEKAVEEKIGKYLAEPDLVVFRMENVQALITNPDMTIEEYKF